MGIRLLTLNDVSPERLRKLIVGLFVVANLFVLVFSAYSIRESRRQHELRARTFTQNMAQAIDFSLTNSIEKIDLALRAVADELRRELAQGGIDPRLLGAMLDRYQERLPEVEAFRVSDAAGTVIFGKGVDSKAPASWADRDYFSYLRDHPDAGLHVSKPRMGRVARKPIVGLERRYDLPDGRFGGVVAAPISTDHFANLLSRFDLHGKNALVIRDTDLGLVASYPAIPGPPGEPGNVMVSDTLKDLIRSGTHAATYAAVPAADNREWLVSYRRLHAAPLIVLARLEKSEYLADWYGEAARTAAWAAAFLLLSVVAGWFFLRQHARIVNDIDERKKQQQALVESENRLRQSEERYRLLLQNSPVGVLHYDLDLIVTFANERFEQIMHVPPGHMLGLDCGKLRDQSVVPPMRRAIEGVVSHYEGPYVTSFGHVSLWVSMHCGPVMNARGEILGGVVILEDITERRRIEEAQRRQREEQALAASVFIHAHEGIIICDANQVILDVNPTFSEITGYERDEIIGRTPRFLSSGRQPSEFYKAMWATIAEQGHWQGEVWNRRKDGSSYAERLTISRVLNEQNQVTHYIGTFSDISLLKRHQAELERMAHYDPLTHLPNRALLSDRLGQALAQARRSGALVTVCYLDLDGFKAVNDDLGHEAGDAVLIEVGRRLKDMVRASDTVARLGGDEFVLLLIDVDGRAECEQVATRVLRAISAPIPYQDRECSVSGSLGVALFPDDGADADSLLRHADQAMYTAKESGKNRFVFFDALSGHRDKRQEDMLRRLRASVSAGELRLHYQPIVDMREGTVIRVEGLLRWHDPERGMVLPVDFLPDAAGTGLEIDLDRWVLEEGLRQLAEWRAQGLRHGLSLNISSVYLLSAGFCDELRAFLCKHLEIERNALQIEILESAAMQDVETAIAVFQGCRDLGVTVALDDFGAGHSSLSFFRRMPVDTVKIDQTFVQSVLGVSEDLAVIDSVVRLSAAFGRQVVAEGIESVEIGMLLLSLGCTVGQGFGIARPMPAQDVQEWIRTFVPDRNWSLPVTRIARDDLPLFLAELEHRSWVRQMGAWLEQEANVPAPPALDHTLCRFGKWYAGAGRKRYGQFSAYRAIGKAHEEVHRLGTEIIRLCAAGRREEARACFGRMTALRDELVAQLVSLQGKVLERI